MLTYCKVVDASVIHLNYTARGLVDDNSSRLRVSAFTPLNDPQACGTAVTLPAI